MKTSFLSNLLIMFAVGLCALCTYQWLRETDNRRINQELHDTVFKKDSEIQSHTNQIRNMDRRIAELVEDTVALKANVKTNEQLIRQLRVETNSLSFSNDVLGKQLEAYTNALATVQERLKEAYDNITRQNEVITNVVAQRDEFVKKLNEQIEERNKVVQEYNKLAADMQKLNEQIAAAQSQQKQPSK